MNYNFNSLSPRMKYERNLNLCRSNLLAASLFTLINIFTVVFGIGFYFPFSASFGTLIVELAMFMCGRCSADSYIDSGITEFLPDGVFYAAIVIAVGIAILYFSFWFFSKKHPGFLITATVFFTLDCLFCLGSMALYGFSISFIIDLAFHAWVMYYLIMGIFASNKLKTLPPDEAPEAPQYTADGEIIDGLNRDFAKPADKNDKDKDNDKDDGENKNDNDNHDDNTESK